MTTYYVLWTYLGNYAERPWELTGNSPEQVAESLQTGFSADFRAKGTVYVFEAPPVLTVRGDNHA